MHYYKSLGLGYLYIITRGPWTATPALKEDEIRTKFKINKKNYIQKLFKTDAIFWEEAQCVCIIVKTATKKAIFSGHTTAR